MAPHFRSISRQWISQEGCRRRGDPHVRRCCGGLSQRWLNTAPISGGLGGSLSTDVDCRKRARYNLRKLHYQNGLTHEKWALARLVPLATTPVAPGAILRELLARRELDAGSGQFEVVLRQPDNTMGSPPRSFATDAHGCIMVRPDGVTEYRVAAR